MPLNYEQVLERLKSRYNIEEDELKALGHNSEEKICAFYKSLTSGVKDADVEDDDEKKEAEPEDNYKPSAEQKKKLKRLEVADVEEDQQKRAAKFKQGAADLSHLPKEQQVTQEDCEAALADLLGKPAPARVEVVKGRKIIVKAKSPNQKKKN